ncbi:hypothetical protein ABZ671_00835 [Micromonospora sp. NPDC006766]|uniref:hypothetical protein n=1 Tax=Micromonospora sp. NPDC006766 TaxID=3154778 RepID=UPI0033EF37A4
MSVRVKVRVSQAGITAMMHQEWLYEELERRADRVIAVAAATAPKRSGDYVRRLRKERITGARTAGVRVVAGADHSLILERGSRPHIIEPKHGEALHWPGAHHPVRRVNHPGTPAMHILRNALRAAGD